MADKKIKKASKIISWITKPRKISLSLKIFFVQQLGVMLKAGISLSLALKTLSTQTESKALKSILADLSQNVEKGNTLSSGLEKYQKIFGDLFINMVRAGEASGKLEEVLKQLFIQMKKDHDIISKVRGAMIYPAIVIVMMLAIGLLMTIYVIPAITGVFREMNITLPLPTRILIFLSDFLLTKGLYVLVGFIIFVVALQRLLSMPQGKSLFHRLLLVLPIVGSVIKQINLARFCRTLSSLLKTDIPIVQSFEITSKVLGNVTYKKAITAAQEQIKKGISIKDSLMPFTNIFPPVVLQMISVGEETGELDNILEESAIFYEEGVNQTMTNLPSIIEPLLMVILGIGVGGMAIAVILPMYTLSQSI
jgi:type IV pilus assembly protein PilC